MSDAATRARELLDKATPWPWCVTYDRTGVMGSPQESITTVIPTVVEFALSEHDTELIAAAPTLLAELADEVDRLRAALHLRDTTPKPPENAAWHWSLISNSYYTKVCAENARLRALTTVDDAMIERAARALCDSWGVLWGGEPEGSREDLRRDARVVLEAALGVES